MHLSSYKQYLKSEHWLNVKRRFRASSFCKNECRICGNKKNLHIHHKTYKRVGNERLSDLEELCASCHKSLHKHLKKEKKGQARKRRARGRHKKRRKRKKKYKPVGIFKVFR